jgi:hypothetical protein
MKQATTPITMNEVVCLDAPDLTNAMTVPANIISRIWSTNQIPRKVVGIEVMDHNPRTVVRETAAP